MSGFALLLMNCVLLTFYTGSLVSSHLISSTHPSMCCGEMVIPAFHADAFRKFVTKKCSFVDSALLQFHFSSRNKNSINIYNANATRKQSSSLNFGTIVQSVHHPGTVCFPKLTILRLPIYIYIHIIVKSSNYVQDNSYNY